MLRRNTAAAVFRNCRSFFALIRIGCAPLADVLALAKEAGVKKVVLLILLSSLLSACVTALAGPISFVGIAVPHITRSMLKTGKPALVIPTTFLCGAVSCVFCDLLARAICQQPEVIILDEPTAYLDIRHKIELLDILRQIARELGSCVISAPAFEPMTEEKLRQASEVLLSCTRVIDAGTPVGSLNRFNQRLLELAREKKISILGPDSIL